MDKNVEIKAETDEERLWFTIFKLNKLSKIKEIIKKCRIGRLEIVFNWRSKKNLWGRFGGGWNWEFGFQASSSAVILNLLIFSLQFYWSKKDA